MQPKLYTLLDLTSFIFKIIFHLMTCQRGAWDFIFNINQIFFSKEKIEAAPRTEKNDNFFFKFDNKKKDFFFKLNIYKKKALKNDVFIFKFERLKTH